MEHAYCEVIGCYGRACWKFVPPPDSYREDYLCSPHWEQLRVRDPYHAGLYVHLSSLLAEGMETAPYSSATQCVVKVFQTGARNPSDPEATCC